MNADGKRSFQLLAFSGQEKGDEQREWGPERGRGRIVVYTTMETKRNGDREHGGLGCRGGERARCESVGGWGWGEGVEPGLDEFDFVGNADLFVEFAGLLPMGPGLFEVAAPAEDAASAGEVEGEGGEVREVDTSTLVKVGVYELIEVAVFVGRVEAEAVGEGGEVQEIDEAVEGLVPHAGCGCGVGFGGNVLNGHQAFAAQHLNQFPNHLGLVGLRAGESHSGLAGCEATTAGP